MKATGIVRKQRKDNGKGMAVPIALANHESHTLASKLQLANWRATLSMVAQQ